MNIGGEKMIEELLKTTHNENEFKKELKKIKKVLKTSTDVKQFIENIRKVCENIEEENTYYTNKYILMNSDYYCIMVLRQYLDIIMISYEQKVAAFGYQEEIENRLLKEVEFVFDECFNSAEYPKFETLNHDFVNMIDRCLKKINFEILEQFTFVRPLVFLTNREDTYLLSNINTMVLCKNEKYIETEWFEIIVNYFAESALFWYWFGLTKEKKNELIEEFGMDKDTTKQELKNRIGETIAHNLIKI